MRRIGMLMGLAAGLWGQSVLAHDGWYAGASLNFMEISAGDFSDEVPAFKLVAGTGRDNFDIEAQYLWSDEASDSFTPSGGTKENWEAELEGPAIFLVPHWNLTERITLIGKIGMAYMKLDEDFSTQGSTGSSRTSYDTGIAAGLGLQSEIGRVHVRLDLDYYNLDFGNDDESGASLDEPWVIGLGFFWGFGGD